VSVDWDSYDIWNPGVDRPLHELSRAEAKAAYDRLMAAKPERFENLRRLLAANGLQLETSDQGIQALNDWFLRELERDPRDPLEPRPIWFSVASDIGLLLGDTMIERFPGLEWRFFDKGKKDVAYQRHVIMGFDTPNPNYNIDPTMRVAEYAREVAEGVDDVEDDGFARMLKWAEKHSPQRA